LLAQCELGFCNEQFVCSANQIVTFLFGFELANCTQLHSLRSLAARLSRRHL